jgi:hypothetical protein
MHHALFVHCCCVHTGALEEPGSSRCKVYLHSRALALVLICQNKGDLLGVDLPWLFLLRGTRRRPCYP